MPAEFLIASEAARRLGVPTRVLMRLIRGREIRYVMVDGIAHVPEERVRRVPSEGFVARRGGRPTDRVDTAIAAYGTAFRPAVQLRLVDATPLDAEGASAVDDHGDKSRFTYPLSGTPPSHPYDCGHRSGK